MKRMVVGVSDKARFHLHGDIGLYPLSEACKPPTRVEDEVVVMESGITGNRHVLRCKSRSLRVWSTEGHTWVHCDKPFQICHEGPSAEHGVQEVAAGLYDIVRETEWSLWEEQIQQVID
jgi:hypothetical protein